jgi:hypothetical protein
MLGILDGLVNGVHPTATLNRIPSELRRVVQGLGLGGAGRESHERVLASACEGDVHDLHLRVE